ncbi:MAG: glutamine amidotransferase [Rhodocyclales bacterium GWA2_65_20]|nr:MAG: glutamine amidotransferase [Rhodocyclales bacterium GWA2_65_20]
MKPVAIFRHSPGEGAGYFATFLDAHSVPWQLVRIDAGDPAPATPDAYSGLCFMGGPMSVNDDLPWIAPVLALIRTAVAQGIPTLGHCLGGQLMAKALGGSVGRNPVKELGWGEVSICDTAARDWLGDLESFEAFHWHGETFTIPPGATRILSSRYCENQAFVSGPHLGLQCHVEMTAAMIRLWNRQWAAESATASASVQTPEQMDERMEERIAAMRRAADRLYEKWIGGLRG